MPFHIRLQNRTEPKVECEDIAPARTEAALAEFCQGISFGTGIALIMLGVLWLVQINGLGI